MLSLLFCAGMLQAQSVTVSPSSLTTSAQAGSSTPGTATLTITDTTGATWMVIPQVSWLTVSSATGNTSATITVSANPANLSAGIYSGNLLVYSGGQLTYTIPVTFNVGVFSVSPSTLAFEYQLNGTVPSAATLTLTSTAAGTFTATSVTSTGTQWLQGTASGTLPGAMSVALNPAVLPTLSAGTYYATITITPAGLTVNTPVTVTVTLTVTSTPALNSSATSLVFYYQTGGTNNQTQQNFTLTPSAGSVTFTVTVPSVANPSGRMWLVATPLTGVATTSAPATITVGLDLTAMASLPQGTYSASITVNAPGASNPTQSIPVTLVVSSLPLLNIPVTSLTFSYQIGSTVPAAQTVNATATSGAVNYLVTPSTTSGGNWLLTTPSSGTTPAGFSVSLNSTVISSLAAGTYTGNISVTGISVGNTAPAQITVTLKVSNEPMLTTSSSSLTYVYQTSQTLPAAQFLQVGSSTGATLTYSASAATTSGTSWLLLSGNTSGSTPNGFTVAVSPAGLSTGSYDSSISITATNPSTATAAPNSPVTVPVKLYVSSSALLQSSLSSLTFTTPSGVMPGAQTLQLLSTSASETLNFTVGIATASGGSWLSVNTISGQTPGTVTVTALPTLLTAGTYSGTITITAVNSNGSTVLNSPLSIPVTLQVTSGTLSVSPAALSLSAMQNGARTTGTLTVSGGGQALTYTAAASSGALSWLSVSPTTGSTTAGSSGTLTVTADPAGLTAGTYTGTITVLSPGASGSPATVNVTFVVASTTISATPTSLSFTQNVGGTAPAAQTVTLTASGGAAGYTVAATTQSGGTWLLATPTSGTASASGTAISVSVSAGSLAAGTYNGTVTITSIGAAGSPISIPVTLTVGQAQALAVSPSALNFTYQVGGTAPSSQTVQVTASPGTLTIAASAKVTSGSGWLAVTPTSGTTPATLTVSVNAASLTAGTYNGTIEVTSAGANNSPRSVSVTLVVSPVSMVVTSVVNGASFVPGAVSPGEIVSIMGTNLAPATVAYGTVTAGVLDTKVGDVQVLFDGVAAPILATSASQINCIVPYEVSGKSTTQIQVVNKGNTSAAISQTVAATVPGIFTLAQSGTGPGAVLNQDYSVNLPSAPAAKGSYILVYATGEGQTYPAGVNGKVATASSLPKPLAAVSATIGGVPARVAYAGGASGMVAGAVQLNIEVPADAPSGQSVPLLITFGNATSQQGVTVSIR